MWISMVVVVWDYICVCIFLFFFFKQKTAYEMRISDWSSDVCSSDLAARVMADNLKPARRRKIVGDLGATVSQVERKIYRVVDVRAVPDLILNSKTVHEAIVAVAKSMSKHMPSIEGIEITTENDNQIR